MKEEAQAPLNNTTDIVEIAVKVEEDPHENNSLTATISQHPMMEISTSPGHLLLLKLWQREEHTFALRCSMKETRMDCVRRDIFQLCVFFLLFHGLFSTIIFMSSISDRDTTKCRQWWVSSVLSVVTSLALATQVQMKLHRYWKVAGQLQRQKGDNRALTRCIQELRMKGAAFDLDKEPQINCKRMKSSSVEIKWKPITWCEHYFVTLGLLLFAGLVFPAPKLFLCIF